MNQGKKAAVIGAGLGGLSAAITLAAKGFAVTVYEKNDKAGGKLNAAAKDGFSFDLGPSILTLPHIFRELFDLTGRKMDDYVTLTEIVPHWRNFFEDGSAFDLTPDMRFMERELEKIGAGARDQFYAFLEYSRQQYLVTNKGYFEKGFDTPARLVLGYGPAEALRFDLLRTMNGGVSHYVKNEKLRHVLNYFAKYVGSSPYRAPGMLNLLPYVQFGFGLWYVNGGMYALAGALEKYARELGVQFKFNAEVAELVRFGKRIIGLVLAGNIKEKADVIVSNMEAVPAYRDLLKENAEFLRKYRKFEPACSGLVVHLGVRGRYPQLAHHNFFYSRDSFRHFDKVFVKHELPDDPTIYVVAPCVTDPAQAPEGCSVIKILPHIPYIRPYDPPTADDYLKLKELVIDKLERMGLKDLRKNTVAEEVLTPVDIQRMYYSNRGSIYGVVADLGENLGFKIPKKSEKYDNLYFTGGSINPGGGMPMVTLCGRLVGEKIAREWKG